MNLLSASLLLTAAAMRMPGPSPPPLYSAREVAARGAVLPLDCVWEPSITIGSTHAVLSYNVKTRIFSTRRTGFAVYDRASAQWTYEGLVPEPTSPALTDSFDSSVVSTDATTFVVIAEARDSGATARLVMSRITVSGTPSATAWASTITNAANDAIDKPWGIAGDQSGEVFLTMSHTPGAETPGYAYQRTVDNGTTWYPTSIADAAIKVNGSRVLGYFCAQPTLAPDGSYYIAYMQN